MAKPIIEYVAIYGMVDTPDSPSSVARLTTCDDPIIHTYEICNPRSSWFVANTVARYFIGLESGGYKISEQAAENFIKPWRNNWPQPKHQIGSDDLK